MANFKKPIKIRTNTNYFNPELTRVVNTFQSPRAYSSRKQKIEGYETRLYWQFRYCDENNGQTFFYTLTYNDRHMPRYYGQNCFDYEDLRDLLTGGFRKQLLRKYGTTFKYFIGAELGDGKGTRGMANNPHYHILFFLEDAKNERYPYRLIKPEDFRHLVRMYWQGFDEDETGYQDYRTAKYGIAREGENLGAVTDFRACMYCAKYVTKDVKLTRFEGKLREYLSADLYDKYYESEDTYKAFFYDYVKVNYETVDTPQSDYEFAKYFYCMEDPDLLSSFILKHRIAEGGSVVAVVPLELTKFSWFMPRIIERLDLGAEYIEFCRNWIVPKVHEYIKEYRNRYCNKCRISQGVGDYAFQQPDFDKFAGVIDVPSKDGFKSRPINLYYYRKLFTTVETDENGPRYVINDDGVLYKCSKLPKQLERVANEALSNLETVMNDRDLYYRMITSDVNERVFTPYDEFFESNRYLLTENNKDEIVKRYAEYKFIYEDRFFKDDYDTDSRIHHFPTIDPGADYYRFTSTVVRNRNAYNLRSFFEDDCQGYISYSSHPYFLRYIGIFDLLDLCSDYFFIQSDNQAQKEAEDRASIKRFHDRQRLNEFYSRFRNN